MLLPALVQKEDKKATDGQHQEHLGDKVQNLVTTQGEGLGERLGETRSRILDMLKEDSFIAIPKISAIVGVSETAIQNNLAWLKAHGFVHRVGGARGGHWEVDLEYRK